MGLHQLVVKVLSKGDPLAEVAKEMGHNSAQITFDTYDKWLPQESWSNINELDDVAKEFMEPRATDPQPETKKDLAL